MAFDERSLQAAAAALDKDWLDRASRKELERALTPEDVREQCEAFAEQTHSVLASRTPA